MLSSLSKFLVDIYMAIAVVVTTFSVLGFTEINNTHIMTGILIILAVVMDDK